MSLLSTIQAVCNEVGIPEPTSVIDSTDRAVIQLLSIAHRVGNDLRQHLWAELTRQHSFTLTSGTASYALPVDFDQAYYNTHWNQDEVWPLNGPYSPSDWAELTNGLVSAGITNNFRLKGYTASQFFIYPTPDSGNAGQTLVYEYQSKNWVRPRIWTASTVYAAGSYTFYNGNYYSTTLGGTTGSTPPTHTSSSASDGGVSWTYYSGLYSEYLADTDCSHLDEFLVGLGVQWNYLAAKGLPYLHLKEKYEKDKRSALPKLPGGGVIDLLGNYGEDVNRFFNTPDTGYGS